MTLPTEVFREPVAIVGRVGSGKSYTARGAIEHLLRQGERVCIIDPTSVHWGLRSSADGESAGFPVAVFGGTHADVPIAEASAIPLARIIAERNFPAVVDVAEMGMAARVRFVTDFLEELYARNRERLTLVIDEADLFAPQRAMPDQTRLLNRMEQIVRRGRVRGFIPWLITQRPAELHKSVLSQAGTLIAMRLTSPQDRNAIGGWIEGQADRAAGKELLATLPKLGIGEGYVWCPAIDFLERMKFPLITTFDSSRTPEHGAQVQEPARLADVDLSGVLDALKPKEDPKGKAKPAGAAEPDPAALAAEYHRGYSAGFQAGQQDEARAIAAHLRLVANDIENGAELTADAPATQQEAGQPAGPTSRSETPPAPQREARPVASALPKQHSGINGPQQRLLDAIAWMNAIGVEAPDNAVIAYLSEYSAGSSSYRNPRSALHAGGLIAYDGSGGVTLTPAGRKKANAPARPGTAGELRNRILDRMPGPERKMLAALISAYPRAMSAADLAKAAGYTAESSSFRNPRSRLSALGFITYPAKATARAADLLFPKGLA